MNMADVDKDKDIDEKSEKDKMKQVGGINLNAVSILCVFNGTGRFN